MRPYLSYRMWLICLLFGNRLLDTAAISTCQTSRQDYVDSLSECVYLKLCSVTAHGQSSARVSFICFGFLMPLSWLWIVSFHLPARQQDCQTPESVKMKKEYNSDQSRHINRLLLTRSTNLSAEKKYQGGLFWLRTLQPGLFPLRKAWNIFQCLKIILIRNLCQVLMYDASSCKFLNPLGGWVVECSPWDWGRSMAGSNQRL